MLRLHIPIMKKTGNKYSPHKKILVEKEVSKIRAYTLSGCGSGSIFYQALIDGEWVEFLKKDQPSNIRAKLPVISRLHYSWNGSLVRVGSTASSSGYKVVSNEVEV